MRRYLLAECRRVLVRVAGALLVYGLLTRAPWPTDLAYWIALGAAALLVVALLIICGTFLYNTFFFDRYWRQVDSR